MSDAMDSSDPYGAALAVATARARNSKKPQHWGAMLIAAGVTIVLVLGAFGLAFLR